MRGNRNINYGQSDNEGGIRKPAAIILEDFHTHRGQQLDVVAAVTHSRDGKVDIACRLFPHALCRGCTWFSANASLGRNRTDWGTPVNWSGSWWSSSAEETSGCRTRRASSPRARAREREAAEKRLWRKLEREREREREGTAEPDLITKTTGHRRASVCRFKG